MNSRNHRLTILLGLCCVAVLLWAGPAASAADQQAPNLLPNPSFEEEVDGRPAQWKTHLTASVIHMVAVQTLNLSAVYEGPISESLVDGLKAPEADAQSEFVAQLIDFARQKVQLGLTERWKDPEQLENDVYRSRFAGVLNFGWSDLRGRGRLERTRSSADIHGASSNLSLESLGQGNYRIEMRSTVALGPLPVL